jgi:DNA-binding MarR family transcriptional regulator
MPRAEELGMDPSLRFPSDYRHLRLPFDECVTELERQMEKRREYLAPRQRMALLMSEHLDEGAAASVMAAALGRSDGTLSTVLRTLEKRQLVRRTPTRPAIWSYTDLGRELASDLGESKAPADGSTPA